MISRALLTFVATVATITTAVSAAGGHGHGSGTAGFEWAGVFPVTAGANYTWMMQNQKATGQYPDAHQELVLFVKDPVSGACVKDHIESNEARAKALLASTNYTEIEIGQVAKLTETVQQFSFHNNPIAFLSLFTIEIPEHDHRRMLGAGDSHGAAFCMVVFCKHSPLEFEGSAGHFFKDIKGGDVEPDFTEVPGAAATTTDKSWALGFVGTAITCIMSLAGALLLMHSSLMETAHSFTAEICAFGLGTVMAAVFLHILPEAAEQAGGFAHNLPFGVTYLAGFFASLLLDTAVHTLASDANMDEIKPAQNGESLENGNHNSDKKENDSLYMGVDPMAWNILIGDLAHNIADGFIIGAAFGTAGTTTGWIVTLAVCLHELPQELSDFLILVRSGFTPQSALMANFASSLSAMLGCIIVVGLQSAMDLKAQGYILAFGVGMLTFACCEMSTKVCELSKPGEWGKYAQRAFLFMLGVTIIGLTMMYHPAELEGVAHGGDAHAGHNH